MQRPVSFRTVPQSELSCARGSARKLVAFNGLRKAIRSLRVFRNREAAAEDSLVSMTEQGLSPRVALSHRAVLIKVDSVMDLLGKSADEVYELADGGTLLAPGLKFVFNLAADPDGDIRDLRFWTREIIAPASVAKWSVDQALDSILPNARTRFQAGEVTQLLHVRRPTLMRLREELQGKLAANSSFFERTALVSFLKRRWLGTGLEERE